MQRPKHLDPVQSYTVDESLFTARSLEPPQYHYLKRPYELITLTATELPKPKEIEGGKFTVYEIRIRPASAISRIRRSSRKTTTGARKESRS